MDRFEELREAVEKVELIDGHAHNIVAIDSNFQFIRAFSEADTDEALSYAHDSLSFKRSVRELAELYGCEPTLQGIEEYRRSSGIESITSTCFRAARISGLLLDDGIPLDKRLGLESHKSYVPFVGRILRIETLAEEILNQGTPDEFKWNLDIFTETFVGKLKSVAPTLLGLKSIIAYRSGLEISTNVSEKDAEDGLLQELSGKKPVRITNKNFIDYVFTRSLEVALLHDLPVQLHTGFGDKDIDLRLANPLHLRALLEDKKFLKSRIVLLHASYPFSREASYLASVYSQIYLDFGLAIPKLSVQGMISSVKELLELASTKKVMFSSDGIAFPETFYLGARKGREVVFSVLRDACVDGDLSVSEAVEAAKDILSENAIQFYKIKFSTSYSKNAIAKTLAKPGITPSQPDIAFVRIIWVDNSGQCRCRAVPSRRFHDVVKKNGVGLTCASMGMTSFADAPAVESKLTGVGEIRLIPDLSTLRRIPWSKHEEMVLSDMHVRPGKSWEYCPREALRRVSNVLKDEFNLEMNAGFENEFYVLKSVNREGKEEWVPFDSTSYCSTSSFDDASPILQEVLADLQTLNIPVEQLHAEAGKGQLEMALGHTVCTQAADNLIYTREVIRAVARKHGLLATFVPKYVLDDIGSGSHVHLSLWKNGKNVFMGTPGSSQHGMSKIGEEFMAGVLHHLPAILAFTAPNPNSYDRIQPNTWSGAYQCWGKENREAPLRTACPPGIENGIVSNFEIKAFDACANPYLALAAIMTAGIDGLRNHLSLPDPVDVNPADLDGIKRLPTSLSESLESLKNDDIFDDLIGKNLLVAVKGVRQAEIDYYAENKEAYKQLIYRY